MGATPGVAVAKSLVTDFPQLFQAQARSFHPCLSRRGLLSETQSVALHSGVFFLHFFVQNLVELLQLPGLEEDRAFQKEIGLKTLVFKAYRYGLMGRWGSPLPPGIL